MDGKQAFDCSNQRLDNTIQYNRTYDIFYNTEPPPPPALILRHLRKVVGLMNKLTFRTRLPWQGVGAGVQLTLYVLDPQWPNYNMCYTFSGV
jgi:hypothetical protein